MLNKVLKDPLIAPKAIVVDVSAKTEKVAESFGD